MSIGSQICSKINYVSTINIIPEIKKLKGAPKKLVTALGPPYLYLFSYILFHVKRPQLSINKKNMYSYARKSPKINLRLFFHLLVNFQ